jgi:hypothetical protein
LYHREKKMNEMIDTFMKKEGTLEEWGNDREKYFTAFGQFATGWIAREEESSILRSSLESMRKKGAKMLEVLLEIRRTMIKNGDIKTVRKNIIADIDFVLGEKNEA